MGHGLNAKHTFAFAIDLEGQLAAVQLEDGQIILPLRLKQGELLRS